MNIDQQTRLEIMKALEKDFPDRLLEDLIDVARYVEGNGTPASRLQTPEVGIWRSEDNGNANLYASKIANAAAREFRKAGVSTPRKWTNLEAIPSNVKAIVDRDGDRAEPLTLQGKRKWVFTQVPFDGVTVSPDDGPFTEVPISRSN